MLPPDSPVQLTPSARAAALDWFVRRQAAALTVEEERAYQNWLDADPLHPEAMVVWENHSHAVSSIPDHLKGRLRENLASDLALVRSTDARFDLRRRSAVHSMPLRRDFILAGSAVAAGAGFFLWHSWDAQPRFSQSFVTRRGQSAEVPLPDSTVLSLDTATQVQVAFYGDRRDVTLSQGQAVFAVQPDRTRPFYVRAGTWRITVVGTRFSVRYVPDVDSDGAVQVSVEEGNVLVDHVDKSAAGDSAKGMHDFQASVSLTAGQRVRGTQSGHLSSMEAVPVTGIAPWQSKRVAFADMPLGAAVAELSRYRDTGLVIRDPAVAALRLNGVFDPMDQATFRLLLPQALPVLLQDGDGVTEVLPTGRR